MVNGKERKEHKKGILYRETRKIREKRRRKSGFGLWAVGKQESGGAGRLPPLLKLWRTSRRDGRCQGIFNREIGETRENKTVDFEQKETELTEGAEQMNNK